MLYAYLRRYRDHEQGTNEPELLIRARSRQGFCRRFLSRAPPCQETMRPRLTFFPPFFFFVSFLYFSFYFQTIVFSCFSARNYCHIVAPARPYIPIHVTRDLYIHIYIRFAYLLQNVSVVYFLCIRIYAAIPRV